MDQLHKSGTAVSRSDGAMTPKIREKSALLFVVAALLPILVVSVGSYVVARNALSKFVIADLSHITDDTMRGLERYFSDVATHLGTWSTRKVFRGLANEGGSAEIRSELVRLRKHYPQFAEFMVVSATGGIVAATHRARHGQDVSDAAFFAATRLGRSFQGAVGPSEFAKGTTLIFAVPIRDVADATRMANG